MCIHVHVRRFHMWVCACEVPHVGMCSTCGYVHVGVGSTCGNTHVIRIHMLHMPTICLYEHTHMHT